MDEDYGYTAATLPSVQVQVLDVAILALDSFGDFVRGFSMLLMSHANWKRERKAFAHEAALEIERIASGE